MQCLICKNGVVRGGWRTGRYGITDGIGQIRYMVERVIANMKTWRILHTDCRAPKEKIVMNALKQVNLCRSRLPRSLRVQWCYCHYIMTLSDFGQENP